MSSSSFFTVRLNSSTFLVTENDAYGEHPLIYIKVHPAAPVIVIGDTGCDKASRSKAHARFTHLRQYLECCSLPCNDDTPLNPHGEKRYLIIVSHCHYDHTLGIPQFLRGGQTAIVASAAGRDFIESDLSRNGLYDPIGAIVQPWKVTHWAQAFEELKWPMPSEEVTPYDASEYLGITILHTPGHTPDQLAWYDHSEMCLYVGDSFYERGPDKMDVIWPSQSNLIEWYFSMQKLRYFIRSENANAAAKVKEEPDGWIVVEQRVKLGCGHQTSSVDGESIMEALENMWWRVLREEIPVTETKTILGEVTDRWVEPGDRAQFSFRAPRRLMADARKFFVMDIGSR